LSRIEYVNQQGFATQKIWLYTTGDTFQVEHFKYLYDTLLVEYLDIFNPHKQNTWHKWTYEYDEQNILVSETFASKEQLLSKSEYIYKNNRLTAIHTINYRTKKKKKREAGTTTNFEYDENNRLKSMEYTTQPTLLHSYDDRGNLISEVYQNNDNTMVETSRIEYDSLNRVIMHRSFTIQMKKGKKKTIFTKANSEHTRKYSYRPDGLIDNEHYYKNNTLTYIIQYKYHY
jgi:hypothetical protein